MSTGDHPRSGQPIHSPMPVNLTVTREDYLKNSSALTAQIRGGNGSITIVDENGKPRMRVSSPGPVACDDPDCVATRDDNKRLREALLSFAAESCPELCPAGSSCAYCNAARALCPLPKRSTG